MRITHCWCCYQLKIKICWTPCQTPCHRFANVQKLYFLCSNIYQYTHWPLFYYGCANISFMQWIQVEPQCTQIAVSDTLWNCWTALALCRGNNMTCVYSIYLLLWFFFFNVFIFVEIVGKLTMCLKVTCWLQFLNHIVHRRRIKSSASWVCAPKTCPLTSRGWILQTSFPWLSCLVCSL